MHFKVDLGGQVKLLTIYQNDVSNFCYLFKSDIDFNSIEYKLAALNNCIDEMDLYYKKVDTRFKDLRNYQDYGIHFKFNINKNEREKCSIIMNNSASLLESINTFIFKKIFPDAIKLSNEGDLKKSIDNFLKEIEKNIENIGLFISLVKFLIYFFSYHYHFDKLNRFGYCLNDSNFITNLINLFNWLDGERHRININRDLILAVHDSIRPYMDKKHEKRYDSKKRASMASKKFSPFEVVVLDNNNFSINIPEIFKDPNYYNYQNFFLVEYINELLDRLSVDKFGKFNSLNSIIRKSGFANILSSDAEEILISKLSNIKCKDSTCKYINCKNFDFKIVASGKGKNILVMNKNNYNINKEYLCNKDFFKKRFNNIHRIIYNLCLPIGKNYTDKKLIIEQKKISGIESMFRSYLENKRAKFEQSIENNKKSSFLKRIKEKIFEGNKLKYKKMIMVDNMIYQMNILGNRNQKKIYEIILESERKINKESSKHKLFNINNDFTKRDFPGLHNMFECAKSEIKKNDK